MSKKILLILVVAALLRFWNLGSYPALNADEAALGYNAYSLIETGLDEHGNSWPIHFQSFNDYKPGFYVYLVLPFIKAFGLSVVSTRLPGAILGVVSVYFVYLLAKELKLREPTPLVAGLLLAISPWHIHFSRGAWEVNVATFFILSGLLFFFKGLKNSKILVVSSAFFVLSLYTYHAARVVVPLLVLGLGVIYKKEVFLRLKYVLISVGLGLVFLLPLGADFAKSDLVSRAAGVGLFADVGPLSRVNEQRGEHKSLTGTAPVVLHNKPVNYALSFVENWGDHFGGEFLFVSGDEIQRNKVPETGQLYLFEIFTLGLGFFTIIMGWRRGEGKFSPKYSPILLWIAVGPVAAALTFQSPHSLRSHNIVIPLVLISAVGVSRLLGWINKLSPSLPFYILHFSFFIIVAWSFARYELMYWGHMAKEYPFSSQYGVGELVEYLSGDNHKQIFVTDRYDQPYILFLFYNAVARPDEYSPSRFQGEHVLTARDKYGFSTVRRYNIFRFEPINFEEIKLAYPGSLIVGTDEEIPDEANIVKEIYGTNGYKYFQVVAN